MFQELLPDHSFPLLLRGLCSSAETAGIVSVTVATAWVRKEKRSTRERRNAGRASETFERFFKPAVYEVGVNLGGRDVAVPQGALDHEQVRGHFIEVGGEAVSQAVR